MSATQIVLVHDGIQINLTPKMRTHLLLNSHIYRDETAETGPDKEVYRIDDESNWDAVNAKLSELPMDELNINPPHAPVVHVENNTPNFDAATPLTDYAVDANVDIPEGDPLREKVEAVRRDRNEGRAFRVSDVADESATPENEDDMVGDEIPPDHLEEDDEDEDHEQTGNVLFNTDESTKEPDYDEVVQSYDVLPPEDREDADEPESWPEGWYAVAGPSGIEAYFENERHANAWRLFQINTVANMFDALKRYNKGHGRV